MKTQLVVQILVALTSTSALAFQAADLRKAVDNTSETAASCNRSSQADNYRNLIHKTSVFEEDDRATMYYQLDRFGFSKTEYEHVKRCTGRIICPARVKGFLINHVSTGAICAPGERKNGSCAADRILTVASAFINPDSKDFHKNISKCECANYAGFKTKLKLEDLNVIDAKNDAGNPYKSPRADKVVVRLATPIPDCDPFDLLQSEVASGKSEATEVPVIAITAPQDGMAALTEDFNEPVAANCKVTKVFGPKDGRAGGAYTDCDVNLGGFGGFVFIKQDGKLVVHSMLVDSPGKARDHEVYDPERGRKTVSITMSADLLQLAIKPGVRPDLTVPPPAAQNVHQTKVSVPEISL